MTTGSLPAVLVVEDEPIIRMDAVAMIEDAGFRTFEAKSADDGITLLMRHPEIGILFTDIDMPGSMDGLGLTHFVHKSWPTTKIIVASGAVDSVKTALPDGAQFFPKPYPMQQIVGALLEMASAAQRENGQVV